MPVACTIHDSVLVLRLAGEYSFREPEAAVTAAMATPLFHPGMSLLIDARLSRTRRSSEEFRERSEWMAALTQQGISRRFAIVVTSELHQYGMARMAGAYLDLRGITLEIFRDLEEAFRWLSGGAACGRAQ